MYMLRVENNLVVCIIPFPSTIYPDMTQEQIESEGYIFVEEVLQPQTFLNKIANHYINPTTKEQWFEYVDVS